MSLIATTRRLVLGLGPTGLAIARHLQTLGLKFDLADTRKNLHLKHLADTEFPGVPSYLGPLSSRFLDLYDEVVVSPGIPPTTEGLADTRTELVSDIQLFRRAWPATQPLVAITGTNAKSTVTTLVLNILKADGRDVLGGGNLGPQALDLLPKRKEHSIAVLELSSFQLERTRGLNASVSTCLNMTSDHLDWHGSMAGYHRAKHRIFEGVSAIVVNAEDPLSQPLVPDNTTCIRFSLQSTDFGRFGILVHDNQEWIGLGSDPWMPVADLPIRGRHVVKNTMAAFAICKLLGVKKTISCDVAREFRGLPYRTQECQSARGIRFINDSKGTNVGASKEAMESADPAGHLFLLAGGDSKDAELRDWVVVAQATCSMVFVFGRDRNKLADALGDFAVISETMAEAFDLAVAAANPGDIVLLSPACASLDQFPDYQSRGAYFEKLVRKLNEA